MIYKNLPPEKHNEKYSPEEITSEIPVGSCYGLWIINDFDLDFTISSPPRVLDGFRAKWKYACAALVQDYNDEVFKELESIAKKYVSGLEKICLPRFSVSIPNKDSKSNKNNPEAQQSGMTKRDFYKFVKEKKALWGYVDHWQRNGDKFWCYEQPHTGSVSEDALTSFLGENNISLEDFLLCKRYAIIQEEQAFCVVNKENLSEDQMEFFTKLEDNLTI